MPFFSGDKLFLLGIVKPKTIPWTPPDGSVKDRLCRCQGSQREAWREAFSSHPTTLQCSGLCLALATPSPSKPGGAKERHSEDSRRRKAGGRPMQNWRSKWSPTKGGGSV